MHAVTIEAYNTPRVARRYARESEKFWDEFPVQLLDTFDRVMGRKRTRVLNAGSGPGFDSKLLTQRGYQVLCLDGCPGMAARTSNLGFGTTLADLTHLPVRDGSLQAIWAYTSVIHIPREEALPTILGFRAALERKGVLVLGMLQARNHPEHTSRTYGMERHITYYKRGAIRTLLEQGGFRVIEMAGFKYGHAYNHVAFACKVG